MGKLICTFYVVRFLYKFRNIILIAAVFENNNENKQKWLKVVLQI